MGLSKADAVRVDHVKYKNSSAPVYIFLCSECGVEIRAQTTYLKRHSGKCNSCAHKQREYQAAYTNLVTTAKVRGIECSLTYPEFFAFSLVETCHYCDKPLPRNAKCGEKGYRGYFLDRRNNDRGYHYDNCVPCCWECNVLKGARFTYQEMVAVTELLKEIRGGVCPIK